MIKKILFLTVIIIILGGISYLAVLNHNDFKRIMISQAQEELLVIAKSEAQSIEKYAGDIDQGLGILSSEYAIQQSLIQKRNTNFKNEYSSFLNDSFKDVRRLVDAIYLIDAKGIVIDRSPAQPQEIGQDFSKKEDVKGVLSNHRAYTSKVFELSSGQKIIINLRPIFKDESFIGLLRAVVSIDKINELVRHINEGQNRYSLIINESGTVLSFPDSNYVGKNILDIVTSKFPDFNSEGLKKVINKMTRGAEGAATLEFLADANLKITTSLIAFFPIRLGSHLWSIGVVEDYSAVTAPINTNARDNIISVVFFLLVLSVLGVSVYNTEKKRYQSEISNSALRIINKQLHLEINERKRLEKELQECLFKPKQQS